MADQKELYPKDMIVDVVKFELIISYTCKKNDPLAGKIDVSGPIQVRGLCYLMLEMAKDAIRDFDPTRGGGILVPNFVPRGLGRG